MLPRAPRHSRLACTRATAHSTSLLFALVLAGRDARARRESSRSPGPPLSSAEGQQSFDIYAMEPGLPLLLHPEPDPQRPVHPHARRNGTGLAVRLSDRIPGFAAPPVDLNIRSVTLNLPYQLNVTDDGILQRYEDGESAFKYPFAFKFPPFKFPSAFKRTSGFK